MLRLVLFACLKVFIGQLGYAQSGVINLDNMNVLYVGVETPITYGVIGKKCKTTVLRTSQNIKVNHVDSQTTVMATTRGRGFIQVGYVKRDTTWLNSTIYRIKSLPKPDARFGSISSGNTVSKPALLVHRRITASMGSGFVASHVYYTVSSYRFKLLDYNGVKQFDVNGSFITDPIRRAIRLSKGGVILIDNIHASANFKGDDRVLSPIHIKINASDYDMLYADFKVVTKSGSLLNIQNVRKTENLIDLMDSIETGKVTLYYLNKRIENTFFNGVLKQQTIYNQSGFKSLKILQKDSIVQEVTSYYSSGQVKVKTHINDTLFYLGDSSYIKYYNNNSLPYANQDYTDSFGCPNHFVVDHGLTPVGEFEEYYENGNLKCKGRIGLVSGQRPVPKYDDSIYGDGLEHSNNYFNRAVLQGTWYYYKQDGTLEKTTVYDDGVIKNDK